MGQILGPIKGTSMSFKYQIKEGLIGIEIILKRLKFDIIFSCSYVIHMKFE